MGEIQIPEVQDPITVESVREELTRILASPGFIDSRRSSRFLSYIVEAALQGEYERLKEYTIGVEVFGRPDAFDPRLDSVVRVHATQLRKRLRAYYQADCRAGVDGVRIAVPSGTYKPSFERLEHSALADIRIPKRSGQAENADGPVLLVLPCLNLGSGEDRVFCNGLTDELVLALVRLEQIQVIAGTYTITCNNSESAIRRAGSCFGVTRVLETAVRCSEDKIRVSARLFDTDTRRIRWAQRFESPLEDAFTTQENLAAAIAAAVGLSALVQLG